MAIAFVHNKTLKLCLEAYKNDSFASQDIVTKSIEKSSIT